MTKFIDQLATFLVFLVQKSQIYITIKLKTKSKLCIVLLKLRCRIIIRILKIAVKIHGILRPFKINGKQGSLENNAK